uniref:DUF6534 domain-containing protein n=1 Tax=Kwoniella dejecticola CBS 10117 TaxID=1296121 RepID=A0A1A6A306_9TREE|nr:uncharacterized protein I303_05297 [Kwoniella dejecticola CBS 10117]OBR84439.1 hypothetical protein I303_05297 [Kwoniella dejecticola CBS 10117]
MSVNPALMTPEQMEAAAASVFGADRGFNLGPFMIGCLWDAVLLGVLTQQYVDWWRFSRPTERPAIKWLTHWILFTSLGWSATVVYYTLRNFVYYFGRYIVFTIIDLTLLWPLLGATMSAPIQLFYAHRSFRLNANNFFLLGLFIAMIITEVALAITIAIKGSALVTIFQAAARIREHQGRVEEEVQELVRGWQVMTMSTDLLMTCSLAWGLWRSRTGWTHTDALVKKLLMVTIETQLGPTLVLALPKSYTVGYLATLNSRYALRQETASGVRQRYSSVSKPNPWPLASSQLQQATVQVDTEVYVESYQMQPTRSGVSRGPKLSEVRENEEDESVENLDYATNVSKKNLHDSKDA